MSYLDCFLSCNPAVKPEPTGTALLLLFSKLLTTPPQRQSALLSVVGMGGTVLGRKAKCDLAAVTASDFLALFLQGLCPVMDRL